MFDSADEMEHPQRKKRLIIEDCPYGWEKGSAIRLINRGRFGD
jgi:hypothetical protein